METRWPWPPRPQLRALILVLHAQEGGDFFGDTRLALSGGDLQRAGIAAQLVHVHYRRGAGGDAATQAYNAGLDAQVAQLVDAQTLVVVDQAWREPLLLDLQQRGALLVATDADALWQTVQADAAIAHYATYRKPLTDLAMAVRDGGTQVPLINTALRPGPDQPLQWPDEEQPYPAEPEARLPFAPLTSSTTLGTPRDLDGKLPPRRRTLEVSTGCPFAAEVATNPLFAATDAPEGSANNGCSFCFMGGDYRSPPVAESVRLQVDQLRYWQDHGADLQEAVLRDQSALRYLPQLIEACQRAGLKPLGLLVPGRGDAILRWGKELRRAAELCQGSGWWFTLHLIGFESFSQDQLDLYNKGVSVADYASALRQMRDLHRSYPEGFALYAYGASSFILFNPWTRLQDLWQTAQFCEDEALGELARGLTLTRLRLYPNLPLYWKAKREGLLDPGADTSRGGAFAGYSREAGWRYGEWRVAAVELVQALLAPHVRPEEAVGLLRSVLTWVEQRWPQPLTDLGMSAEAAEEFQALAATEAARLAQQLAALQALWRSPAEGLHGQGAPALLGEGSSARADIAAAASAGGQQRTVAVGRHCNNHCQTCVGHHAELADDVPLVAAQISRAAATRAVVLTGREPTLLPALIQHLREARRQGARQVELLTNGRLLATPGAAARLLGAGATRLTVKRHRLADADEDAYTQAAGAGSQGSQGLTQAASAELQRGGLRCAVLLLPVRQAWHELPGLVDWAVERGASEVRVQVLAGELPLGDLENALQSLRDAAQRAGRHGLRWAVDGC